MAVDINSSEPQYTRHFPPISFSAFKVAICICIKNYLPKSVVIYFLFQSILITCPAVIYEYLVLDVVIVGFVVFNDPE